jgi:hypothetical protein
MILGMMEIRSGGAIDMGRQMVKCNRLYAVIASVSEAVQRLPGKTGLLRRLRSSQ